MLQNNNTPLLSVLTTCYNREQYLAEAIESVLNSSYKNLELIIVDDGSKDNSVKIANDYAARDSRVKVYVNEKNLGDYKNRNQAASYANGKYIKYLDADDLVYPWGLEIMVNCMEAFPDAGFGLCSIEQDEKSIYPVSLSPEDAYRWHYFGKGIFNKSPLSLIVKKEPFLRIGGFSGKQHLGDYELLHLLGLNEKVVIMPHGMVWYRIHDQQQSKMNREDQRVLFKYEVASYHFFDGNRKTPLTEYEAAAVRKRYGTVIFKRITRLFLTFRFSLGFDLLKMLKSDQFDFKKITHE